MHRLLRGSLGLLLISVLIGFTAGSALAAPKGIPSAAQSATVRSVVNGDTYRVTLANGSKATVRLLAVDAPDPAAKDDAASCYGNEAKRQAEKLLKPGREIWLEKDKTNKDKDGRLLRYVWVAKNKGGAYLLNEVLVRDGFAVHAPSAKDTRRDDDLAAANAGARAAGRGLWTACAQYLTAPEPEPTTPAASEPAQSTGFTSDEIAYLSTMQAINTATSNYLSDLGDHFLDTDNIDDQWVADVLADLNGLHTVYQQALQVTPPPAFAYEHSLYVGALSHYDQAATYTEQFFLTLDSSYLTLATNELQLGNDLIDQAAAELQRIEEERGVTD